MNPCADDFTPLQDSAIESPPSVKISDENACSSGSAGIRFITPKSDKTHEAIGPLHYNLEQDLVPLQIPLFNHITPYNCLPFGFGFGSHQLWSVQPWYNPVIVAELDCGTSPQPLHGLPSYRPMNLILSHPMSSLQPSAITTAEVVIERPLPKRSTPNRQLTGDQLTAQSNQDSLKDNIKRRDLEYLISGLKPLACTPSNTRRCRIGSASRGLRKTIRKTRERSACLLGSSRDLSHYDRRQPSKLRVEMVSTLPNPDNSASSAASATSATSSPSWSDDTLPLMAEGPSSSDVLNLDTLKLPDSLDSISSSISDETQSPQQLPHVRSTAQSVSPTTNPQQQSLLPLETQPLTEIEAVKSPMQSSQLHTVLDQGIDGSPTLDITASNHLQTETVINSRPESLSGSSNVRFLTKAESEGSSMNTLGSVNSELCITTTGHPHQDTQPLTSGLGSPRKCSTSDLDKDTRSNTFSTPCNKGAFSTLQTPAATGPARNATESGSWSQSKRWMSQTSKERMTFQKMVTNLFHLSANNSPFVPQSPAELTAFRAEMADIKKKRLSREVGRRVATMERRKAQSRDSGEEAAKLIPLLLGRRFKDTLSPVFASRNCFAEHVSQEAAQWVPWPSLPEFKDEGDKRSLQHGRRFPLPRLGVRTQPIAIASEHGYKAPWQMKTVKIDTRFIYPASDFADQSDFSYEPPLTEHDVPYYLLRTIQSMQEELDD